MPADTDTTDARTGGLDILFAAIDYQQWTKPSSSSPTPSNSTKSRTSQIMDGFVPGSKMDPRMKKSIEAKASNPSMSDEEAVLIAFSFPERGNTADIKWIGEDQVSMRQRKINFRRSWKRFESRLSKRVSIEGNPPSSPTGPAAVMPSSPRSVQVTTPAENIDGDLLRYPGSNPINSDSVPLVLPRKRAFGPFPSTLISVISDPAYDDIISWLPSGAAFGIHNLDKFESLILPKYFRCSNFVNFIRKLNHYGFRPMTNNRTGFSILYGRSLIFHHVNFTRDERLPLSNMMISEIRNHTMTTQPAVCHTASIQTTSGLLPLGIIPAAGHGLISNQLTDPRMVELKNLLSQRRQVLDFMSQKTEYSRALLTKADW